MHAKPFSLITRKLFTNSPKVFVADFAPNVSLALYHTRNKLHIFCN